MLDDDEFFNDGTTAVAATPENTNLFKMVVFAQLYMAAAMFATALLFMGLEYIGVI